MRHVTVDVDVRPPAVHTEARSLRENDGAQTQTTSTKSGEVSKHEPTFSPTQDEAKPLILLFLQHHRLLVHHAVTVEEMPSRAPVSTTHHPQHGHGRPARVEVHTAAGALVRPGQGRATLTPPHHHHHRCLLPPPPPPLVGPCLYQTLWQRPRETGDSISTKK